MGSNSSNDGFRAGENYVGNDGPLLESIPTASTAPPPWQQPLPSWNQPIPYWEQPLISSYTVTSSNKTTEDEDTKAGVCLCLDREEGWTLRDLVYSEIKEKLEQYQAAVLDFGAVDNELGVLYPLLAKIDNDLNE